MLKVYNLLMFDTIVAIASGFVNQPISIIRLSGPEAFSVVNRFFTKKQGKPNTIVKGFLVNENNQKIDEVLISWFKKPNSFTGENIVEIFAHGGVVNTNIILKLFLANGARLAEKGEFSKRAFLNKKMNLVKAEAIHDLIFAKTEEQASLSVLKFDQRTSSLINTLINKILTIIATCETNIDYPEYDDIEVLTNQNLLPKLNEVKQDLLEIIESSKSSKYIFEGINTVIVGKPNVGKSSLLNSLINQEKAIVTPIAGTTRDIVESSVQIGQYLLNFKDTAGIHKTENIIEKIGIKKTMEELKKADLIIHVKDNLNDDEFDKLEKDLNVEKKVIKVFNKKDLVKYPQNILTISAKHNEIEPLIKKIQTVFQKINLNDFKIINNTRQLSLINSALNSIKEAIANLKENQTPDVVIVDIQKAWEDLSNILGKVNKEDLLDSIFKNFCLGK